MSLSPLPRTTQAAVIHTFQLFTYGQATDYIVYDQAAWDAIPAPKPESVSSSTSDGRLVVKDLGYSKSEIRPEAR